MADEIKQPNTQPNIPEQPSVGNVLKRGGEIYEKLKALDPTLESANIGKYIVIEVDSERHFLGQTRDEAVAEARKVFPDTVLFSKKIGLMEKASRHNSYFRHARTF